MRISLCLVVKDEENTIAGCLAPIRDLFDDVLVMDTGSTDRTCELLRARFGVEARHGTLEERLCYAKFAARNRLMDLARHPWVLFLDADERITREHAAVILGMADDAAVSGYFSAWNTFVGGGVVPDYKLSLIRRDVRYRGLIHENPQQHVRRHGLRAGWLEGLTIAHHPEPARLDDKRRLYRWRLQCALGHDETWYRYHWFMGYTLFRSGEMDEAARYLGTAAAARSPDFPVECLNSHMVLAGVHARRGDAPAAAAVLEAALAFHDDSASDFEVQVNFRLRPWLASALEDCREGQLERVRPYEFAF
jgi:glycosyltransferase involved in cell wall biosynthesis